MKVIRYRIKVAEGSLAAAHNMFYELEEIAIDYLGAIINETGVHFPEDFDGRVAVAIDAEEIEIPSNVLDMIEKIKQSEGLAKQVIGILELGGKKP